MLTHHSVFSFNDCGRIQMAEIELLELILLSAGHKHFICLHLSYFSPFTQKGFLSVSGQTKAKKTALILFTYQSLFPF